MIANNTLHKIYDLVAPRLPSGPRLFHAIDLVREHAVGLGLRKLLLLVTRFTMEDGHYADPLRAAGLDIVIPAEADREKVQQIQGQLADGMISEDFSRYFSDLLRRHAAQGCEAAILGCTELPLAITQDRTPMRLIDPLVLQCWACVDFALAP